MLVLENKNRNVKKQITTVPVPEEGNGSVLFRAALRARSVGGARLDKPVCSYTVSAKFAVAEKVICMYIGCYSFQKTQALHR